MNLNLNGHGRLKRCVIGLVNRHILAFPQPEQWSIRLARLWRKPLANRVGIGLKALMLGWGISAIAAENSADLFRQFVEHPPVISKITFEIKLDTSQYYLGIWQTNAALIRSLSKSNELFALQPLGVIVDAYWQSNYWYYSGGSLLTWQDKGKPEEVGNEVQKSVAVSLSPLHRVLTMGLCWKPIGTLRWLEDSFSYSPREGVEAKGQLLRYKDRVIEARVTVKHTNAPNYEFRYEYDYAHVIAGLEYLPGRWREFSRRMDGTNDWHLMQTVTVFALETAKDPLPLTSFSADEVPLGKVRNRLWVEGTNELYIDPHSKR